MTGLDRSCLRTRQRRNLCRCECNKVFIFKYLNQSSRQNADLTSRHGTDLCIGHGHHILRFQVLNLCGVQCSNLSCGQCSGLRCGQRTHVSRLHAVQVSCANRSNLCRGQVRHHISGGQTLELTVTNNRTNLR